MYLTVTSSYSCKFSGPEEIRKHRMLSTARMFLSKTAMTVDLYAQGVLLRSNRCTLSLARLANIILQMATDKAVGPSQRNERQRSCVCSHHNYCASVQQHCRVCSAAVWWATRKHPCITLMVSTLRRARACWRSTQCYRVFSVQRRQGGGSVRVMRVLGHRECTFTLHGIWYCLL